MFCNLGFLDIVVFFALIGFVFVLDIEVACYGYEGIDAVKEALRAGLNCSTESMPIKVSDICNSDLCQRTGVRK